MGDDLAAPNLHDRVQRELAAVREGFCPQHRVPLTPTDTPYGPGGVCPSGSEVWCVHKPDADDEWLGELVITQWPDNRRMVRFGRPWSPHG